MRSNPYRNQKMKNKTYLMLHTYNDFGENVQNQSRTFGAIQLKSNNK